jgi:7-cyano-7-deazaguanine synthase in queuosine biosynthesis
MLELSRNSVVLLSGGLDSATALAIARADGFGCHALSFRYGQRHAIELAAAERVAKCLGVRSHRVVEIDLRQFGGSALTSDTPVPKKASTAKSAAKSQSPTSRPAIRSSCRMLWPSPKWLRAISTSASTAVTAAIPTAGQ